MSFCKKACLGYKLSSLTQWLLVLTTWVIPAIALLIICSTGQCEKGKERHFTTPERKQSIPIIYRYAIDPFNKLINWGFGWIPDTILEFAAIIGDPASAIRGAFSEIALDFRVVHNLSHGKEFDRMMKALAMVTGQTKFDKNIEIKLTNIVLSKGLLVTTDPFKNDHRIQNLRNCLVKMNEEPRRLLVDDKLRAEAIRYLRPALVCREQKRRTFLDHCLRALHCSLETEKKNLEDSPALEYSIQPNDPEAAKSHRNSEETVRKIREENQLRQNLIEAIDGILNPKDTDVDAIQPTVAQDPAKGYAKIESTEKGGFEPTLIEEKVSSTPKGDDTVFEQSE
jgi:hypothetical protein